MRAGTVVILRATPTGPELHTYHNFDAFAAPIPYLAKDLLLKIYFKDE